MATQKDDGAKSAFNRAQALDLLDAADDAFETWWRGLTVDSRGEIPDPERTQCYDRYRRLTHYMGNASERLPTPTYAPETPPRPANSAPSPSRGNGEHREDGYSTTQTAKSLGVVSRRVSDVAFKSVKWLWKGKIPSGKITVIQGNPGLGKSQICASLAAVVTTGGLWPVTRDQAPTGSVLILSAEDDVDDTIGPRLEAAGADCTKVHTLDAIRIEEEDGTEITRGFDIGQDILRLIALMHEIGDVVLVIIDPVSAYMGKLDSHKNSDVRGAMERLKDAASRVGAGIILINHLNKTEGQTALARGQGSVAFGAAARAVWGVAQDKEDPQRRYFMPLKSNLGPDKTGFGFSIEEWRLTDSDITTSRISWESKPVTESVEELFRAGEPDEEKTMTSEARDFLQDALKDGPVKVNELAQMARKAEHKWHNVQRAKKLLGIGKPIKTGFGPTGAWAWELPTITKPRGYADRDE